MGKSLAEKDYYDEIFATLKHPVRRQILLLLEQKDEASFTELQNNTGISDTGLLSYHLKELAPMIEQSERGKYSLSEIGQASVALFRKVEREKNHVSKVVNAEIGKWTGKIAYLLLIVTVTGLATLSLDIQFSVQTIYAATTTTAQLITTLSVSLLGMILGAALFTIYDRHYYSRRIKTNIVHSTIFALLPAAVAALSAYSISAFQNATIATGSNTNLGNVFPWLGIARPIAFLGVSPVFTYAIARIISKRQND